MYALGPAEATLLTHERSTADYFEQVISDNGSQARARLAANWILNDLFGLQRERDGEGSELPISAPQLSELLDMLESEQITARAAKELLPHITDGSMPLATAQELDLLQLDDTDAITKAAKEAMEALPAAVSDYQNGKTAAIGRLIGETIKRTGGRGRPDVVRQVLEELLRQ
jgi:aspartyl-tRNA(Asn)/glutamyl-tRNA(Gln) amidotransferase subunit B